MITVNLGWLVPNQILPWHSQR